MIQIKDTIISDEIFTENFICNLCKCKGQCCVEGESGAPVTLEEKEAIEEILPEIWNDLSLTARALIDQQGITYVDTDGEIVTSIINGQECVFTFYDEDGVCKCAIDNAYRQGRIGVQKPISCHLYPIRLNKINDGVGVNYQRWSICKPAIKLGNKENVKIYQFLKEPLIRRFGEEWYNEVCIAADYYKDRED